MPVRILAFCLAALSAPAAMAHAGGGGAPAPSILSTIVPFLVIGLIFYFLLIRPQQQRAKQHKSMVEGIARGDTVVTQGGIIAKVTKVHDNELTVELADGVRVRVVRGMVIDVRGKNAPVAAND